jgi:uncharacterized RDD family membrane protein YckC
MANGDRSAWEKARGQPPAIDNVHDAPPRWRFLDVVEPAPMAHRLGAFVIDMLLVGGFSAIFLSAFNVRSMGSVFPGSIDTTHLLDQILEPQMRAAMVQIGLLFFTYGAYFGGCYSTGGQTLGKRVARIRVIAIDGAPLNWRKGLLRFLGMLVGAGALGIGFLWTISDYDRQAWHDKVAGTIVVTDSSANLQPRLSPQEAREQQRRWLLFVGFVGILVAALFDNYLAVFLTMFSGFPLGPAGG